MYKKEIHVHCFIVKYMLFQLFEWFCSMIQISCDDHSRLDQEEWYYATADKIYSLPTYITYEKE